MPSNDADLKAIRDLYAHDTSEWKAIRDEGTTDMQYAAGDPWNPRDREARERAGRPALNTDEISQYVNQVVNEVRANKRAVKFTPVGNGANDKTALFYADKMREIEYRSRAQIAYTTAFENTVCRSFGFVRVNSRYAHSRAVNQDLWIDPVPNPNLVTPDADALMPDLSDQQHCWIRESWAMDDFNRKFKDYKISKFTSDLGKLSGDWITDKRVFVGEYWKVTTKAKTLMVVQMPGQPDPVGLFEEELEGQPLPDGAVVLETRQVDDPSVVQQLTNGIDILEENQWPGKYIPIIGCMGKVLYVSESGSEKKKILSMIRLVRDPQMMLAYLASCEAELIGMTPKFPYFVYEGQLAQKELDNLAKSLHEPIAVVQVKPTIEGLPPGNGPLGFPQRNPYEPPLAPLEIAKESFRRAIQSAMGQSPLPTSAQRRNEKSGVALKQIEDAGQRGSFHFNDHYLDMLTQVGIVCEDLIDKIYDTARDVGIRKVNDTAEMIRVNDPNDPQSISTKGDHLVTVSTGPSQTSERDAANDFADTLIESQIVPMLGPEKAVRLIAKAIKLKNLGPIGDELSEIISPEPPKDGQPSPEQLQQALQEAQGQAQQAGQQLQQAMQVIEQKQIEKQADMQAEMEKAQITASVDIRKTEMEIASREKIAFAANDVKMIDIQAKIDAAIAQAWLAMESRQAEMAQQQAHDAGMAAQGHERDLEKGEQGHRQQLEAADQGAMHASQQAEQQAALQPPQAGA